MGFADAQPILHSRQRRSGSEADVSSALHSIDCDVHPTVPNMKALLPHLDDFWRETVEERGINSLETVT
jgi:hypothetical protein